MEALDLAFCLSAACQSRGYPLSLSTIADAAGYFQTRRRRMGAFLFIMPRLCCGTIFARTTHDIFPPITLSEIAAGPLTNLAQMAKMARVGMKHD